MYLDKGNEFEPGTTVRLSTNISENVVDGGAPGVIEKGFVDIQVTEAFNTCTDVRADVVTADDAALSTNAEVIGTTGAVARTSWSLNAKFTIPLLKAKTKRYTGLKWTTTGTANTTGKVKAYLTPEARVVGAVVNGSGNAGAMFPV